MYMFLDLKRWNEGSVFDLPFAYGLSPHEAGEGGSVRPEVKQQTRRMRPQNLPEQELQSMFRIKLHVRCRQQILWSCWNRSNCLKGLRASIDSYGNRSGFEIYSNIQTIADSCVIRQGAHIWGFKENCTTRAENKSLRETNFQNQRKSWEPNAASLHVHWEKNIVCLVRVQWVFSVINVRH